MYRGGDPVSSRSHMSKRKASITDLRVSISSSTNSLNLNQQNTMRLVGFDSIQVFFLLSLPYSIFTVVFK